MGAVGCRVPKLRVVAGMLTYALVVVSIATSAAAVQPLRPGLCSTAMDCSLNGDCVDGRCVCDAAWSAHPQCDVLAFDTARQERSLGYNNASNYSSWGGNAILGPDGRYHLFVAQFANKCELGDWGSNSLIVRAVSDSGPAGPFRWAQDVIMPFAHNPTVRALPEGQGEDRYVLYMIGGTPSAHVMDCTNGTFIATQPQPQRAISNATLPTMFSMAAPSGNSTVGSGIRASVAPSLEGPWSKPVQINFTADSLSDMLWQGGTNPSPHVHPNGSVTLAFQMHPRDPAKKWELVGVATAPSWRGPFTLSSPDPVTAGGPLCVAGRDEDPFLWRSPRGYHIITHGMCPTAVRQAHYKFSLDGKSWTTSPRQTYSYKIRFNDGGARSLLRVERPQLQFANHDPATGVFSNATTLYNAVCEGVRCIIGGQTGRTHTWARLLKSA